MVGIKLINKKVNKVIVLEVRPSLGLEQNIITDNCVEFKK